ncbi:MAG: pyridoxal phosphate-dependent aminotransferase [Planctomycetota bacterium]
MPGAGEHLLSERSAGVSLSRIRKLLEHAATIKDPINLTIGQPDFPVDDKLKSAAVRAINSNLNGYAISRGYNPLVRACERHIARDLGWPFGGDADPSLIVTSGTSGALLLAILSLLNPGDEIVLPDPYFIAYPAMARLGGATAVYCDVHPDFRMTAERVEPLITDKTKAVLFNSPSNPGGVVLDSGACGELAELCRERGVILISDEIYDEFTFDEGRTERAADPSLGLRCPSPARRDGAHEHTLVVRGFGKTYGVTGWRLGYATGPAWLIDSMLKMQQYTFVCPPTPLQAAAVEAFEVDVTRHVSTYERRARMVVDGVGDLTSVAKPHGAFYAYVEIPARLGSAEAFVDRCVENKLLVIPGTAFSRRDTHIRVSLAAPDETIARGVEVLRRLLSA